MWITSRRVGDYMGLPCAIVAALYLAAGPAAQAGAAAIGGDPMPAVWKQRRLDFFYKGRMARYTCDGLRDKVRAMLLDLGARRDVKIVTIGCDDNGRLPVNSAGPSLNIIFSSPALPDASATPQTPGDLAATDARFEAFTIAGDAFRNMGISDCELVEEFARQILPKLTTRNVKRDIACATGDSRFLVHGEVLKTIPLRPQVR
jgi:hypothetical protein